MEEPAIIVDNFSAYFENLFNVANPWDEEMVNKSEEEIWENSEWLKYAEKPEKEEIINVIQRLKEEKAGGIDEIIAEHLKWGGDKLQDKICVLIQLIWEEEKIPEDWEKANTRRKTD